MHYVAPLTWMDLYQMDAFLHISNGYRQCVLLGAVAIVLAITLRSIHRRPTADVTFRLAMFLITTAMVALIWTFWGDQHPLQSINELARTALLLMAGIGTSLVAASATLPPSQRTARRIKVRHEIVSVRGFKLVLEVPQNKADRNRRNQGSEDHAESKGYDGQPWIHNLNLPPSPFISQGMRSEADVRYPRAAATEPHPSLD
jgi:hypothetical protein